MSTLSRKVALTVFAGLSGALAINVLVLQPPSGRGLGTASITRSEEGNGGSWLGPLSSGTGGSADAVAAVSSAPERVSDADASQGGSTAELVRAIQRELKAKGYETGAVDGVAGLVTRAAIMAYEADTGLAITGEPRQGLLQHIVLGSAQGAAQGARSTEAGSRAAAITMAVQKALTQLGYAAGAVDGHMSAETSAAIRKFEADHRLPRSGRISGELVAKLTSMTGPAGMPEMR